MTAYINKPYPTPKGETKHNQTQPALPYPDSYLVMFLKYFLEAHEVETLVILQQDQAEVEFGEGQFEVLRLPH